jgi:hypothetical protein
MKSGRNNVLEGGRGVNLATSFWGELSREQREDGRGDGQFVWLRLEVDTDSRQ